MQVVVLAIRFALELCLLAAFALWGWNTAGGGVGGAALGLGAAAAAALAWRLWIGPKSGRRLSDPARLVLEVALFVLGGLALANASRWEAGAGLAVGSCVVALLVRRVGEPAPPRK